MDRLQTSSGISIPERTANQTPFLSDYELPDACLIPISCFHRGIWKMFLAT